MNTPNKVPMLDMSPEVEALWPQLSEAIESVIKSGQFVTGPVGQAFEKEAAAYLGVKHAVGLNSGTDALVIGLRAAGVKPGDEVITSSFSFFATGEAVSLIGAKPVFVDIEPDSFNLDPKLVEKALTPKTKALLPVHLFGLPANLAALNQIAKSHSIPIVEDVAQAFGADIDGKKVGSFGAVGAFSFYPTKNLGAYGDGGLLTTNDDAIAEDARRLRNHGSIKRYHNTTLGYNSRLDEIQAAILRIKLPRVDKCNELRREVASRYDEALSGNAEIETPKRTLGTHVFHQYTIRIKNGKRDKVQAWLSSQNIASMLYYPIPIHQLEVYRANSVSLPETERAAAEVLSLPIWPEMTPQQSLRVVEEILRAMK